MNSYVFARGTAVVTGAASGIGEALARDLAGRGSSLVLLDRDADRLAAVAASLSALHPTSGIATVVVDLSDREATDAVGARLAADHPETTLLINCAGVALAGSFTQVSLDDVNWLLDINFRATVTLTHHLLPVLQKNPGSHLANVSSVFGIIAPAGQVAYVSSKFAVRGFTEALRAEAHGTNMGVTCIHPGGIRPALPTAPVEVRAYRWPKRKGVSGVWRERSPSHLPSPRRSSSTGLSAESPGCSSAGARSSPM